MTDAAVCSRRPTRFAGILLLAVAAGSAVSTQPAQQPPPVFRIGVDVVRLDVSVLDLQRRPVLGLAAEDFTILVDGVPQPIAAFEPVVLPPREVPTAPWMREVAPDVRTNALGEPRLFIIVMDDVNERGDPWRMRTAKEIARGIVDELQPGDLAAVLFTDPYNRRWSQDFTDDRAKLLEAISRHRMGMALSGAGYITQRTLKDALAYLQGRPSNRSALIVIGMSMNKMAAEQQGHRPPGGAGDDWALTTAQIGELSAASQVARVPIYWFSTAGLEAPGLVQRGLDARPSETLPMPEFSTANAGVLAPAFVDQSGGWAVMNTNAPAVHVPRVFEENSAYYVIGYRATHPTDDGRYRRLQIRVNRPGVDVFPGDRRVLSPKAQSRRGKVPPSPLFRAMSDILPQSDLPLRIAVAPFAIARTRSGATTALAVNVAVRQPPPEAPMDESVELLGRVFTVQGKPVTSVAQTAAVRLVPTGGDSQYELLSRLDLKPGRYLLRYSVHSASTGTTGSVYTDLTVPDFSRAPLSLSGIVLSATPAPRREPADVLSALVPVVPTTLRELTATHDASAFVRVYQGGKKPLRPVDVEVALTDRHGAESIVRSDHLEPARFGATRATDYTVALPLARLAPGAYLLTIRATAGESAARGDVRFSVR
jgi:VWFA-related protein